MSYLMNGGKLNFSARVDVPGEKWSIGVPEKFYCSTDPKINGESNTNPNGYYDLEIVKPRSNESPDFNLPYANPVCFVTLEVVNPYLLNQYLMLLKDLEYVKRSDNFSVAFQEFSNIDNVLGCQVLVQTGADIRRCQILISGPVKKDEKIEFVRQFLKSIEFEGSNNKNMTVSTTYDFTAESDDPADETVPSDKFESISKKKAQKKASKDVFPEHEVKDTRKKLLLKGDSPRAAANPKGYDIKLVPCFDGNEKSRDLEELALILDGMTYDDEHKEMRRRLYEKGLEYSKVFHVSDDAFDSANDTESMIKSGYIKSAYQLHALRSFSWTLTKWCAKNKKNVEDVTVDEVMSLVNFIEEHDGANYNSASESETEFCGGIRPKYETSFAYVHSSGYAYSLKCEREGTDENKRTIRLSNLIDDLILLEPLMNILFEILNDGRDEGEYLDSTAADILAAWCTFAIYSICSFSVENGAKKCALERNPAVPELKELLELEENDDGFVIYNGILLFVDYEKNAGELIIPDGVTKIAHHYYLMGDKYDKFGHTENVEKLTIPGFMKNITYLPRYINLKELTISQGVEIIDGYFFSSLEKLVKVTLPKSLKQLKGASFAYNKSLTEIELPEGLEFLHMNFSETPLKELVIPAGVTDFGEYFLIDKGTKIKVYSGSYAEKFLSEYNKEHPYSPYEYEVILTPEQQAEKERAEAEARRLAEEARKREEERRRAEEERLRREAEEKAKREEEERLRREAEEKARREKRLAEYNALVAEKKEQLRTIEENKGGLFGEKPKKRKAAKERLDEIESKLKEYPEFG